MTELIPVDSPRRRREFHRLPARVHRDHPQHRATEDELTHLLVDGNTVFLRHARLEPWLAVDKDRTVARFALLQDLLRPEDLQLAFYEALPEAEALLEQILPLARERFPRCTRLVAGLNGHLNYSAGFLADRFELPPVFGLPWSPPYYLGHFRALSRQDMLSFRFPMEKLCAHAREVPPRPPKGVRLRTLDRSQLRRDTALYTQLNNACFQQHPHWADRTAEEDYELFHPFRHLLDNEHLILAEGEEGPLGFLLWYPDFNELVGPGRTLGLRELLRYRLLGRRPETCRLTEIAVVDSQRRGPLALALLREMGRLAAPRKFRWCEGGFIFEENRACLDMTLSGIQKLTGERPTPFRRYCVFTGPL